jgi:hypothetical protein
VAAVNEQVRTARRIYGEIVANALADPAYRAALEADPRAVLEAAGLPLAEDARVVVLASAPTEALPPGVVPFVLEPTTDDLSEDDLAAIAGGSTSATFSSLPSCVSTLSSYGAPG